VFTGIPADAFDFFEELTADNTKAWWTANKARYERNVRGPVEDLLTSLADEFGPTWKIFRPYRDTRFSKDKTPYKTNLGATSTDKDGSVWYVALAPEGMYVGGGYYRMAKDQIAAFRAAVAKDETGAPFAAEVAKAVKAGYEVGGEQLKRIPPGFDKEHPRGDLLRHKGIYLGQQLEPAAWMGTKKAADRVAKLWRGIRPVQQWLHANVGPSELGWE
jgi:uncharacterized protein (TIGR02453 family)